MYHLTVFLLLLAPCTMIVADNTTNTTSSIFACSSQLAVVSTCYLKSGKIFDLTNNSTDKACVACNMKANANLTSTSPCADVDKAVCSAYASCKDNCTIPGSCSDEVQAYYLCVISSAAGPGKCQVQCNGTSGLGTSHSSAGPDRFLGVATIAISAMFLVGFII